jgi:diguanylate cyclase (GGDEF)-like protein/PAS domain S-box-containing protein
MMALDNMMTSDTQDLGPDDLKGSAHLLWIQSRLATQMTQLAHAGHSAHDIAAHIVNELNQCLQPKWIRYSEINPNAQYVASANDLPLGGQEESASGASLRNVHLLPSPRSAHTAHHSIPNNHTNPCLLRHNVASYAPSQPSAIAKDAACMVEIPLKWGDHFLGIFHLFAPQPMQWSVNEIEIISNIAQMLSLMLINESLKLRSNLLAAETHHIKQSNQILFNSTPMMVHVTDRTDRITAVSDMWLTQMGYDRNEVIGTRFIDYMTEESRYYAETAILITYFQTGRCHEIPFKLITKDGRKLDVLFSGKIERDSRGTVLRCIESMVNVTRQREVEQQLYREKELAQVTLQSIGDAVVTTDIEGRVDYLNPIAEQLTGWRVQEAKGRPITEVMPIIHEMTREPITNPIHHVLKHRHRVELVNHAILVNRFGPEYAIQDAASPIVGTNGTLLGAVLAFRDVTQTRLMERQLAWQASHDGLTGLMNRREFERKLSEAIASVHHDKQHHVLCYLDLDRFKVINDSYGHAAGDELIRQVAILLKNHLATSDVIARLGGDEFGIILYDCSLNHAQDICDVIRRNIQEFRFVWQSHHSNICVSIGIVQIDDNCIDLAQAMSTADAVCYAAKQRGRNRVYPYQANDPEVAQQRADRQWIERLNRAMETDRFHLYAQTIQLAKHAKPREIQLHEVLLRLVDEEGELVLPLNFMPAAEQHSFMPDIDQWVIRKFLQTYGSYHKQAPHSTSAQENLFAINLSGASVNDDQFLDFVKRQFEEFQVPPQHICFEITERVAIANLEKAAQLIREIKCIGCQFALDDFGSGVSSFSYLRHLPIDYLKIDGNFVRSLLTDPVNCAIVESVNHIGHLMGIQTIAEFVETEDILTHLDLMGIDYVQGFAVHRPVPLEMLF